MRSLLPFVAFLKHIKMRTPEQIEILKITSSVISFQRANVSIWIIEYQTVYFDISSKVH